MRRKLFTSAIAVAGCAGLVFAAAMPGQATSYPVNYNWLAGFIPNIANYQTPPTGAITVDRDVNLNFPAKCTSSSHPYPVILVHGTWENQHDNWEAASPLLRNAGYCVYSFNYGGDSNAILGGTNSVASSAAQMKTVVDKVLAVTGAGKVDLVGHSQGGMMPRYYIKFLGGEGKVDKFVALAPSNHGTTLQGLGTLGSLIGLGNGAINVTTPVDGAFDQIQGSALQKKLATCAFGPAQDVCLTDPTKYTVIESTQDEVVTPYTNAFLVPSLLQKITGQITNITVQNVCSQDNSEHLAITYDSNAYQMVLNALAGTNNPIHCVPTTPFIGG